MAVRTLVFCARSEAAQYKMTHCTMRYAFLSDALIKISSRNILIEDLSTNRFFGLLQRLKITTSLLALVEICVYETYKIVSA